MDPRFLDLFESKGKRLKIEGDWLLSAFERVPIRHGIPRFSPDISYSSGNFSLLRERHAKLQLDSINGTRDRLETILSRTNWPRDFFKDKTILECGCGAGPDTEVLAGLGAYVLAVDLSGLDIAKKNVPHPNVQFVQADIMNLPLRRKSFDIVFCHRVLQHTPNPGECLQSILSFVKDSGAVFVHSYAFHFAQLFRWKYVLRPITKRIAADRLYQTIRGYATTGFRVTRLLNKYTITRYIAWVLIPFLNYRHQPAFKDKSDEYLIEYGIHDTFDALSPKFDRPLPWWRMRKIATQSLQADFEIVRTPTITLLRSKLI